MVMKSFDGLPNIGENGKTQKGLPMSKNKII